MQKIYSAEEIQTIEKKEFKKLRVPSFSSGLMWSSRNSEAN